MINQINRKNLNVGMPKLFIGNSPAGVPDTPEDWQEMEKYASRDPFFYSKCIPWTGADSVSWAENTKGYLLSGLYGFS